jgi:hypothetical protein
MVDATRARVDDKSVDLADSLPVRADDLQAVEPDYRVIDVSRIEITKP